jgi:hypothetical protein
MLYSETVEQLWNKQILAGWRIAAPEGESTDGIQASS